MYTQELKLAEKLIKKNKLHEGISLLLQIFISFSKEEHRATKDFKTACRLLASILSVKRCRVVLIELNQSVAQIGIVYLLNFAVEFGQLKGTIATLEEFYSLHEMELATLNYYVDILDSDMQREKALRVAREYLDYLPTVILDTLKTEYIKDAWDKLKVQTLEGHSVNLDQHAEFFSLIFKIIKLLYGEGRLKEAQSLVNTIQPLVEHNPELNVTKAKNSYSYFGYISKLLPLKLHSAPEVTNTLTLYAVGDSHCFSPAWGELELNNLHYQVKPLLVTGCKIWHLRDESEFYTKSNFYSAINRIPKGANALFIFGEIDCREGIFPNIVKGIYSSPVQAINLLIDFYMKKVLETVRSRSLEHIYVHQIPPVLEPTRSIVTTFNQLLAQRIHSLNHPKISWMHFQGDLLDEQGGFNSVFDLDDTHLHPSYIHTYVINNHI